NGRSVCATKILARWRSRVRKSINEGRSICCEHRRVRASFLGQPCEARPIKSDAVELPLHRRFFRGGEVNEILRFVNGVNLRNLPITFGKLRELLAADVIQIQVAVAAALAGPQKTLSILEEKKIVADVDPVWIFLR